MTEELPLGFEVPDWTPRKFPPREPMRGERCVLEPLDAETHALSLHAANGTDTTGMMWTYLPYGPFGNLAEYEEWIRSFQEEDEPMFFAIVCGDRALGVASYLRIDPENGSIEIGHVAYSPLLQQTAPATEAMYLMLSRVFDELGYRRCEWKCDSLNERSRRAAERLGFTYEGTFRQARVRRRRNRDDAWFSIIDTEWPAVKAGFEAWLDPSNFDPDGKQRRTIAECRRS